jgi:ATP-dependent Clp protease ATP-binding subunit ClpA
MTMTSPPPTPVLNGALGYISQQLGLNVDSVKSALKGGSSIDDLAKSQGVSVDTLRKDVAAFIESTRKQNQPPPIPDANLTRMLERAFSHHRRGGASTTPVTDLSTAYGSQAAAGATDSIGASGGFSILA